MSGQLQDLLAIPREFAVDGQRYVFPLSSNLLCRTSLLSCLTAFASTASSHDAQSLIKRVRTLLSILAEVFNKAFDAQSSSASLEQSPSVSSSWASLATLSS